YFIIAWSAFLLGGAINTLMVLGYLPNLSLTMYASQIGSEPEAGLPSLALADPINAMKKERARTLQDAGRKLEATTRELAYSTRLMDECVATVTHGLRTPMNGAIVRRGRMGAMSLHEGLERYQRTAAGSALHTERPVNASLAVT